MRRVATRTDAILVSHFTDDILGEKNVAWELVRVTMFAGWEREMIMRWWPANEAWAISGVDRQLLGDKERSMVLSAVPKA